jgi:hypothetical protein
LLGQELRYSGEIIPDNRGEGSLDRQETGSQMSGDRKTETQIFRRQESRYSGDRRPDIKGKGDQIFKISSSLEISSTEAPSLL